VVWDDQIKPLLLERYPGLTDDEIHEAHAYAYGGAVIQDLGYYPFGSHDFSNLAHYVRTGDFVEELIRQSQNANELAFALGALAHYVSDIDGHPAVNQSVGIEYPKLQRKFGRFVTFEDDKSAHLRTEFSFDVVQVAKERYLSQQYHDFIGFEVAQALLERTFPRVYGIEFKDVIAHEDMAIGTYRYSISRLIPKMTQVALLVRTDQTVPEKNDAARRKFLYHLSRADYEREWGKDYRRPGPGTRFLAWIITVMPKIGPFKALKFKNPTAQTEDLYFKSFDQTIESYREDLKQVRGGNLNLPNRDCDTGKDTRPGEYALADETYAKLLKKVAERNFENMTPELQSNVLAFFGDGKALPSEKKHRKERAATLQTLDQLRNWQPAPAQAVSAQ